MVSHSQTFYFTKKNLQGSGPWTLLLYQTCILCQDGNWNVTCIYCTLEVLKLENNVCIIVWISKDCTQQCKGRKNDFFFWQRNHDPVSNKLNFLFHSVKIKILAFGDINEQSTYIRDDDTEVTKSATSKNFKWIDSRVHGWVLHDMQGIGTNWLWEWMLSSDFVSKYLCIKWIRYLGSSSTDKNNAHFT